MKIAVSTDEHTHLVDAVVKLLEERGHTVVVFGPRAAGEPSVDWPEVTARAVEQVASGACDEAVVMCWTGTGATLAANKVAGVRAALCHDAETARGARTYNHANVLGLSLRATSDPLAKEIVDAWLTTPFGDDDWNRRQVARIAEMEERFAPRKG